MENVSYILRLFDKKMHIYHFWSNWKLILKKNFRPEKLCCLCNLSERSQLGQGELLKYKKPDSFVEEKTPETEIARSIDSPKVKEVVTGKHKKSASRFVNDSSVAFFVPINRIKMDVTFSSSSLSEPIDEHSIIGHADKMNMSDLFDEEGK